LNLARRLAKLEKSAAPTQESRIVVVVEGCEQPPEEELAQATQVIVVRFVKPADVQPEAG